jgi:hypothetical protein
MQNWNLIFRRTHLYLGMLLLPWTLVYALSTVVFNHVSYFTRPADQPWTQLWEKDYAVDVPTTDEGLRALGRKIFDEHGIKGAFGVQRQGPRVIVGQQNFRNLLRVVYEPQQKKLRAESRERSKSEVMTRMHTRVGYGRDTFLGNVWAVIVDVFCVTTLIWIATGLYLWWKLPMTRGWGFLALGGGVATIGILLATL